MSRFGKREHRMPGLNTASLPDMIFTVLFFFMIVTNMRETDVKVEYTMPQATQLDKLTNKSTTSYIYIGRPMPQYRMAEGSDVRIQMNDKFVSVDEVSDYITTDRMEMTPEDQKRMKIDIRADRDVPMGIISDVKMALRHSYALNIVYSASPE